MAQAKRRRGAASPPCERRCEGEGEAESCQTHKLVAAGQRNGVAAMAESGTATLEQLAARVSELRAKVLAGGIELRQRRNGMSRSWMADMDDVELTDAYVWWTMELAQCTRDKERLAKEERRRLVIESAKAELRRREQENKERGTSEGQAPSVSERESRPVDLKAAPSEISLFAQPGTMAWEAALRETKMCTFRLNGDNALPIDLFHDAFLHFRDNLVHAVPTDVDCALFRRLARTMRELFAAQGARMKMFTNCITRTAGFLPPNTAIDTPRMRHGDSKTTMCVKLNGLRERVVSLIEVRDESDTSGHLPACYCYHMYVVDRYGEARSARFYSINWPVLLLIVDGATIRAVGAVRVGDRVVCQGLGPIQSFSTCPRDRDASMDLLRFVAAVRIALDELAATKYALSEEPAVQMRWLWAYPYRDAFGGIVVRYDNELGRGAAIFMATVTVGNERVAAGARVVVKFVQGAYGIDAHRFMAERDMAPAVHAYEEHGRRWHAVVMEYVEHTAVETGGLSEDEKEQMRGMIAALHEGGFVLGDFRLQDVLRRKGDERLVLCDFDWAGKEGEARYSSLLNSDICWPDGAHGGALITRAHDMVWLERHLNGEGDMLSCEFFTLGDSCQ